MQLGPSCSYAAVIVAHVHACADRSLNHRSAFKQSCVCVCVTERESNPKAQQSPVCIPQEFTHLMAEVLLPTGLTGRGLITGKRAWLLTRAPFWITPRGTEGESRR